VTPAEVVRRGFQAFVARDFDTLRAVFADDLVWRIPGGSALAGEHRGIDGVLAVGRTLDIEQAVFCRVDGEKIVEVEAVPFDQRAFDEFWS
jgi:ketosteroid isomerase-like protein